MSRRSQPSIVHLINGLGVGGAENMLLKLLSGMDRARFSNVVVTLTDGGVLRDRLQGIGVPVYSLGMRRGRPSVSGMLRLMGILRRLEPDLVQTWLYHADLLGLIAARLTGVPHCAWNIRASNLDMRRYPRISRWVVRVCARLSRWPDLVLTNSATAQAFHETLGYHPKRWQVIPNGFDTDRFRPDATSRRGFRDSVGLGGRFVIGLIARSDPMKDHPNFLQAAALFLRERPEARFLLAGGGIDEDNGPLVELAEELGVRPALVLLGERHDLHRVLPALDVLTLCSAFGEGFSNAVGEGMACGVPCVVTDVGDMAEVVGSAGRIIPPADPVALRAAWDELYSMGPEARSELGRAGRRRVGESYEIGEIVKQYEEIYAAILENSGRT